MMKKKIIFGLSLTAVALFALGACGSKAEKIKDTTAKLPEARFEIDEKTPSWEKDKDHPAKLKWYVNFDWYAQPGWGVDTVTRKIKEDMNIDVEFISGNDEKLNTMMASGNLPDIMTFDKNLTIAQDAPKFALPLNKLAEKYDPYFLKEAAKEETLQWYTKEDGNIYGYPSFSVTEKDYKDGNTVADQVFIVRKDIYEAIGSPDMSTPKGFIDALEKAKKATPEASDGSSMITLGMTALDIANGGDGAMGGTLQDFLAIPVSKDGKWNDRDADPEYAAWLEVLRQAYQEGFITDEQFSDNDNTMKEKLAQGKYFAYMHSNTKGLNEFMSDNNKRDASQGYIAIDGPKNSKGDKSTFTGGSIGGWTNTFITKKTEEPQKAMELITYLTSKYGNMVTTFGIEGETYDLVDGKVKYSKETEDLKNSDIAKFDKTVGLGSYWFTTDSAYTLSMGEEPATSIRQMVDWASDKMEPRFEIEDIDPTPGTSLARNLTTINTNRVQAIVKVFEAKTEKEGKEIWDAFLTSRDNDNFEAITKERNKNMEENINRLK